MQIEKRKDYLPTATHFAVIPDEGGVRVGSGGATLSVIRDYPIICVNLLRGVE